MRTNGRELALVMFWSESEPHQSTCWVRQWRFPNVGLEVVLNSNAPNLGILKPLKIEVKPRARQVFGPLAGRSEYFESQTTEATAVSAKADSKLGFTAFNKISCSTRGTSSLRPTVRRATCQPKTRLVVTVSQLQSFRATKLVAGEPGMCQSNAGPGKLYAAVLRLLRGIL